MSNELEEPMHAAVTLEIEYPSTATARDVQEAMETAAGLASLGLGNREGASGYVAIDQGRAAGTRVRYRVGP